MSFGPWGASVKNTAKEEVHPKWCRGGNPDAIVAQERRGQDQLVKSQQLPVRGSKALEQFGVELGPPLPNDKLFCMAKLPKGWTKKGSDHDMWSSLLDANGKEVASIFYKASHYDRDAFVNVNGDYTP
jgi:hypothetical protein